MRALQNVPHYKYKTLGSPREIRLLRLLRRKPVAPIRCELVHVPLDTAPPYEAISYVWGDPTPVHDVVVDGYRYRVTASVYEILHLRQSLWEDRLLWVDYICIDQSNKIEKSEQVRLMREIFHGAMRVIAWLGPAEDAYSVFLSLRTAAGWALYKRNLPEDATWERTALSNLPKFGHVFTCPWFERVWIVQEVATATTLHVFYGSVCMKWETFAAVIKLYANGSLMPLLAPLGTSQNAKGRASVLSGFLRAATMVRLYGDTKANTEVALSDVLLQCITFKASDPRDKTIALLGLTNDGSQKSIIPDYTKSVQEVYVSAIHVLLSRIDPLSTIRLAGVGYPRSYGDLPSWVPDFSQEDLRRTHFVGYNGYCAGSVTEPMINTFVHDPKHIHLAGSAIDEIGELQPLLKPDLRETNIETNVDYRGDMETTHVWVAQSRSMAERGARSPYPTGEPWEDAYWRTLIGDRDYSKRPVPSHLREDFRDFKWWLGVDDPAQIPGYILDEPASNLPHEERTSIANRFKRFQSFWWRLATNDNRFCITKKGYMGLVPHIQRKGTWYALYEGPRYRLCYDRKESAALECPPR